MRRYKAMAIMFAVIIALVLPEWPLWTLVPAAILVGLLIPMLSAQLHEDNQRRK